MLKSSSHSQRLQRLSTLSTHHSPHQAHILFNTIFWHGRRNHFDISPEYDWSQCLIRGLSSSSRQRGIFAKRNYYNVVPNDVNNSWIKNSSILLFRIMCPKICDGYFYFDWSSWCLGVCVSACLCVCVCHRHSSQRMLTILDGHVYSLKPSLPRHKSLNRNSHILFFPLTSSIDIIAGNFPCRPIQTWQFLSLWQSVNYTKFMFGQSTTNKLLEFRQHKFSTFDQNQRHANFVATILQSSTYLLALKIYQLLFVGFSLHFQFEFQSFEKSSSHQFSKWFRIEYTCNWMCMK